MGVLKPLETVAIKAYSINCMHWNRRSGNSRWQIQKGKWTSLPGLVQNCRGDSCVPARGPSASGRGGPFSSASTPSPGTHRSRLQSCATSWGLHSFLARDFTVSTHLLRDQFLFCLPALSMCCGMISSISTTVTFLLPVFGRPASEKERVG